jgi:hypothetical protein
MCGATQPTGDKDGEESETILLAMLVLRNFVSMNSSACI